MKNRIWDADIDESDKTRIYIFKSDWKELNALKAAPRETFASVVHHILACYVEFTEKRLQKIRENRL